MDSRVVFNDVHSFYLEIEIVHTIVGRKSLSENGGPKSSQPESRYVLVSIVERIAVLLTCREIM